MSRPPQVPLCDVKTPKKRHSTDYFFSNEDHALAFSGVIDYSGKSIAAVCAGGDFIAQASQTAHSIHAFDISENASHFARLKLELVRNISFSEFHTFYTIDNASSCGHEAKEPFEFISEEAFAFRTYEKVRDNLPEESQIFFDYLFTHGFSYGWKPKPLARTHAVPYQNIGNFIGLDYLQDELNYKSLQRKVQPEKISFNNHSLRKLEGKFDIIYVSNVIDSRLERNGQEVLRKAMRHLNDNGQLLMYAYRHTSFDDPVFDTQRYKSSKEGIELIFPELLVFSHKNSPNYPT